LKKIGGGVNNVNIVLLTLALTGSWLCLLTTAPAQTFGVKIGHKKLLLTHSMTLQNPSPASQCWSGIPLPANGCGSVSSPTLPHGLLLWVNDDSEWEPVPACTQSGQRGWAVLFTNVSYNQKTYTVYYYSTVNGQDDAWVHLRNSGNDGIEITLQPKSTYESQWLGTTARRQDLRVYLAWYSSYWEVQNGCYQLKSSWSSRVPDTGVLASYSGRIGTIPISSSSADAAIDNRPICFDPALGYEYPKFGSYTYLGGLFVGQVPQYYGSGTGARTQTNPDLSATGRTLLRFNVSWTSLPGTLKAGCLTLFYRASPNGVFLANTNGSQAIGVYQLPSNLQSWTENSVTWQWLIDGNYYGSTPLANTVKLGSTNPLADRLKPGNYNDFFGSDGKLKMRAEMSLLSNDTMGEVTIPFNTLSLWNPSGQQWSGLVALDGEGTPLTVPQADPLWYYFLGKEHSEASSGALRPRLWLAW